MKNNKTSSVDLKAILSHQRHMSSVSLPADHIYYDLTARLSERLDYIRITPAKILIIGWYTENITAQLQQRYPDAHIQSVASAAMMTIIADNTIDLVISHFAITIEPEPLFFLQECYRVLQTEGLLLFTTLGPDTLYELREAFSVVDDYPHVHAFVDMHHVGDWMRGFNFVDPVVDREEVCLLYDEMDTLIQDCRAVGFRNVLSQRRRGLMTKHQWNKMLSQYALLKQENYFPVTIEMIYGHAWKGRHVEEEIQEVTVSIDAILRNRK